MPGIPPPMPPPIGGIAGSSDGASVTPASVVRSIADADDAFWRADLVTFAGSTIPAPIMSTYSSVAALKPVPSGLSLT